MNIDWGMFAAGCASGLIPDAIRLAKDRYAVELPAYWKSPNFWMGLLVLVGLGGVAAVLGQAEDLKSALAFGFAAPEIISRTLSSNKPAVMRGGGLLGHMRRWWAF